MTYQQKQLETISKYQSMYGTKIKKAGVKGLSLLQKVSRTVSKTQKTLSAVDAVASEAVKAQLRVTRKAEADLDVEQDKLRRAIYNNQPNGVVEFVQFHARYVDHMMSEGCTALALAVHYGRT